MAKRRIINSLIVGLGLVASDIQRYKVLWAGSAAREGQGVSYFLMIGALFVVAYLVQSRGRGGARASAALVVALALGGEASVVLQVLMARGVLVTGPALALALHACKTLTFLLTLQCALHVCRFEMRDAATYMVTGIAFAGIFQIFVSLFGAGALSYGLCLAVVPCLAFLLLREGLGAQTQSGVDGQEGLAERASDLAGERLVTIQRSQVPAIVVSLAMIALSSFFLLYLNSLWINTRNMRFIVLVSQICAGAGALVAANLLVVLLPLIKREHAFELAFMLIAFIILLALYLTRQISAENVGVLSIPLNMANALLAFVVWLFPLLFAPTLPVLAACYLAFFARRAFAPFTLLFLSSFSWFTWVLVAFIAALVVLCLLRYAFIHAAREQVEGPIGVVPAAVATYDEICRDVAERYQLTPRELDVMRLVGRGRDSVYIARALGISQVTVKTHTSHAYQKLGISSKQQLLDLLEELQGLDAFVPTAAAEQPSPASPSSRNENQ